MDTLLQPVFCLIASAGPVSADTAMEALIALVALSAMEIVLGIDNVVFIAILVGRLPEKQRALARNAGLGAAMVMRILLLLTLTWILGLVQPILEFTQLTELVGLPSGWLHEHPEINEVSWRDIILLVGGLFLVGKSVHEIHHKLEGPEPGQEVTVKANFWAVLAQIAVLDIIFSLDSVITAVGMVRKEMLWVMITAIVLAVLVMLVFAAAVSRFVEKHPTLKMLALSFLILIGVMLIADAIGTPINKGYIYFAMAFALGVEVLNLRLRGHKQSKAAAEASSSA
jgi:predicted tellurium resistance membrane protein TerC